MCHHSIIEMSIGWSEFDDDGSGRIVSDVSAVAARQEFRLGLGLSKANAILHQRYSIASGQTLTIDLLNGIADSLGRHWSFSNIKSLFLATVESSSATLSMDGPTSLIVGTAIKVKCPGTLVLSTTSEAGFATNATVGGSLALTASGGTVVVDVAVSGEALSVEAGEGSWIFDDGTIHVWSDGSTAVWAEDPMLSCFAGFNILAPEDYRSAKHFFDMGPHASVKIDPSVMAGPVQVNTVDANGWPATGTAQMHWDTFAPNSWPNGTYEMSWTGSGSVSVNLPVGVATGTNPKTFTVTNAVDRIILDTTGQVTSVSIKPQSTATQSGLFTSSFIDRGHRAACVRFMDGLYTNAASVDPSKPGQFTFVSASNAWYYQHGWTWDNIVAFSQLAQTDVWITIHHLQYNNNAYLDALAATLMGCWGKVYVEFSNEVWNSTFPVNGWIPTVSGGQDLNGWYADRADIIAQRFKAIGGAKFVGVLASQAVASGRFATIMSTKTRALDYIDVLAIAPYWGGTWTYAQSAASIMAASYATMQAAMQSDFDTNWKPFISAWATSADSQGWDLVAYEYGAHLTAHPSVSGGDPARQRLYDFGRSDEMAAIYTDFNAFWDSIGGCLACHYADVDFQQWGRKRTELETSPGWTTIESRFKA